MWSCLRISPNPDGPRTVGTVRARLQQVEDLDGFVEWVTAQPGTALSGRVRGYTGYREDTSGPVHRWENPVGNST